MGVANIMMTNFTGGEVSPRLYGRIDLAKYSQACRTMENAQILPHGPAVRRSGFQYISHAAVSSGAVRLVPFVYSQDTAYILELTDGKIRYFADGGMLTDSGAPYETVSPYTDSDISGLKYCQSADVLYFVHPGKLPKKLMRYADTDWRFENVDLSYGPWLEKPLEHEETTLSFSAVSGDITVSASADLFTNDDNNRHYSAGGGAVLITSVTSPTSAEAQVVRTLSSAAAASGWRPHAFSPVLGYPCAVSFAEQRLCFAGTKSKPQTVWLSRTDAYEDFSVSDPLQDDDACSFTYASGQVNNIQWLASGRVLTTGTIGSEWATSGDGAPLTPSNIKAERHTTYGCADIQPENIGQSLIFVQRGEGKIRELAYNFMNDDYRAPDLTLFAEHMFRGRRIKATAYAENPDPLYWCITDDGGLFAMTYLKDQEVTAWHRHTTAGTFQSICTAPSPSGRDELWCVVKRYINGQYVQYIERLSPQFEGGEADDAFFVDSGLMYDGAPVSEVSGLEHLEGETVQILADGAVHPERTVTGGKVTLERSASKISAGLGYETRLETLNIEAAATLGTAQAVQKRITEISIRFDRTLGAFAGTDFENMDEIFFRDSSMKTGQAPGLFSGDYKMLMPSGWQTDGRVCVKQTYPLPMTVSGIIIKVITSG